MIAVGLALAGPAVFVRAADAGQAASDSARAPILTATIVARYPHDKTAFTEGLLWHDGALYESTGQEGASDVRRVRLVDGQILAKATIPAAQFGEGLALWAGQLISLTWHDGIAHRWDVRTLKPKGDARYTGEGWGLTADATQLIQSDGSPTLIFRDPKTFAERRRIPVTIDGRPLRDINELEYVRGAVLANVWHTGFLVRIDPATGRVTAVVDLRPLVAEIGATGVDSVLNGIAWDAKANRLFVTGKYWPTLFEIRIDEPRP
jgi:glutamine cyclotransferase